MESKKTSYTWKSIQAAKASGVWLQSAHVCMAPAVLAAKDIATLTGNTGWVAGETITMTTWTRPGARVQSEDVMIAKLRSMGYEVKKEVKKEVK